MCTLKVLMSLESCWTLVAGNVAVRMRRFVYDCATLTFASWHESEWRQNSGAFSPTHARIHRFHPQQIWRLISRHVGARHNAHSGGRKVPRHARDPLEVTYYIIAMDRVPVRDIRVVASVPAV